MFARSETLFTRAPPRDSDVTPVNSVMLSGIPSGAPNQHSLLSEGRCASRSLEIAREIDRHRAALSRSVFRRPQLAFSASFISCALQSLQLRWDGRKGAGGMGRAAGWALMPTAKKSSMDVEIGSEDPPNRRPVKTGLAPPNRTRNTPLFPHSARRNAGSDQRRFPRPRCPPPPRPCPS